MQGEGHQLPMRWAWRWLQSPWGGCRLRTGPVGCGGVWWCGVARLCGLFRHWLGCVCACMLRMVVDAYGRSCVQVCVRSRAGELVVWYAHVAASVCMRVHTHLWALSALIRGCASRMHVCAWECVHLRDVWGACMHACTVRASAQLQAQGACSCVPHLTEEGLEGRGLGQPP